MTTGAATAARNRPAARDEQQQAADVFVDLRNHGRPRQGDDIPVALPTRAARAAQLPDRRRRRQRLDGRAAARARARVASRTQASRSTRAVFDRLADRLSYVQGDFDDAATYERVADAIKGAEHAGVLPGDPAVPVRQGGQGPDRGGPHRERPGGGREAVRPRPRVGAGARGRAAPVHRRVPALPDRPLPREDGTRRDPVPTLREHDARAGLEPQLHRVACRSRWPRASASRTAATSTTRSARCATWWSTTSCRSLRRRAMEAPVRW